VGDHTVWVTCKQFQHSVLEGRQTQFAAVAMPSETPLQIHADVTELKHRLGQIAARVAAQNRARPRDKLRDAERHFDIVVSARIEGRESLRLTRASRNRDDRNCAPYTKRSNEVNAALVRQTEIGNDNVWAVRARIEFTAGVSVRENHSEPPLRERSTQNTSECSVVFDNDYAMHGDSHFMRPNTPKGLDHANGAPSRSDRATYIDAHAVYAQSGSD
jgi:hypothetical protein